jgi:hypothetical protein
VPRGGARGCSGEATTLANGLCRWQASQVWPSSHSRPDGMDHISHCLIWPSCSATTHPSPSSGGMARRVLRGGARGCSAEASTLANGLCRWQASQAWPSSHSRPDGMKRISQPHFWTSCSATIHPSPSSVGISHRVPRGGRVHLDVQLKPAHLLMDSADGRPVRYGP